MHIIKASPEIRELAAAVPISVDELCPVAGRQIWIASSSLSLQETALLDYYDKELFPTITQKAESNGLSHLVRDDRPRIICIEKGGRIWPGKDQVAVSIVLKPPKMEDEISETVKEIDKTGLNLHDSDPPIECPPSHTPGPAGDVGAQKSSETHKGQGIINQLSEEITLPVSGILQKIRDRRQDLLRTLRQPRQVVTWKMTDRRPSSVEPRILGVGDTVVLNGREFIDLRAGGIPLLAMRCWGERLEDVEGGEASEPSAAA